MAVGRVSQGTCPISPLYWCQEFYVRPKRSIKNKEEETYGKEN
jgi:hypothetical protein